jgi:hypothetical protein
MTRTQAVAQRSHRGLSCGRAALLAALALIADVACGSDAASNCPARCAALAQICPEIDPQTDCNYLCASKPSELLLSCLEASDCAVLVDVVQDHPGCGFKAATADDPARCQGAAYDHIGFSSSNASCQCPLDIYDGGEHAGRVGDPCSDAGPVGVLRLLRRARRWTDVPGRGLYERTMRRTSRHLRGALANAL